MPLTDKERIYYKLILEDKYTTYCESYEEAKEKVLKAGPENYTIQKVEVIEEGCLMGHIKYTDN